jgi:hypothetical protein
MPAFASAAMRPRQQQRDPYEKAGNARLRNACTLCGHRNNGAGHATVQSLENRNRGIQKFYYRMVQMRQEGAFQGHVYGPVATEIRMRPGVPQHAATAVEMSIPSRVMAAFVVEHGGDRDTLRECVTRTAATAHHPALATRRPRVPPAATDAQTIRHHSNGPAVCFTRNNTRTHT